MKLKRFSDFTEKGKIKSILEEKEEKEEIDLDKKTGDDPEETKEEKENDDIPVSKNVQSEKEKEEKDKFEIEILKENIIKFNNGHIKNIYKLLSEKYSSTDYFLRKKNNDIHVVKYNENLKLNVNAFVDSLFKFYSTRKDLIPLTKNIKIKGNDKFSVIENVNIYSIDIIVNDLSNLLSKKK